MKSLIVAAIGVALAAVLPRMAMATEDGTQSSQQSVRIAGVEIDADGQLTQFHVDVVNEQAEEFVLVAAYGLADGGDDPGDWTATATVGPVASGASRIDFDAPAGYGTSWKYLRFFLVEHIGFTICQALKGDGTAYVDTKRKGVTGDGYEITYKVTGNQNVYVMGSRTSANANNIGILAVQTGNQTTLDYAAYNDSRLTANGTSYNHWYRAKLTKDERSLDNLDKGTPVCDPDTRTSSDSFETPENIYLFNFSGNPAGGYGIMTGSIREYIVTTDGGAATNQHFVAAQKTNGTAGFYDRISGGFFGNAADEGSFTVLNPTDEFFPDLDEAGVVAESELFPSGPVADVDLTDVSVSSDPLYSPVLSYGARFLDPDALPETANSFWRGARTASSRTRTSSRTSQPRGRRLIRAPIPA